MKKFLLSFFLTLVLGLVVGNWLLNHIEHLLPGATMVGLPFECHIIIIDTRLQPENTIVGGCPRLDGIRLWPLPIEKPWCEDCYEEFWKRPEPGQEIGARIPGLDDP